MKRITLILCLIVGMMTTNLFSQDQIFPKEFGIVRGNETGLPQLFDNNIQSGWFPGWNSGDYPVMALIDFGDSVKINQVKFYDWVGQTTLTIHCLEPKLDTFLNSQSWVLDKFAVWQTKNFNEITTRYLVVELKDIQGDIPITELQFFYQKSTSPPQAKQYSGDALKLGTNGFHWVPSDLIPFKNIRVYQMSQWTWTSGGLMVEPSYQANAHYDSYYRELKQKGIEPIPCINKVPSWFVGSAGQEWPDKRFHKDGQDPKNPESYKEISEYVFQLVARYGSVKWSTDWLKVNQTPRWNGDEINMSLSGLDLLKFVEIENEPDRPWKSPEFKYEPEEFAAFCSAIYDGHEGKLGPIAGLKTADPKVKLVMAGLSALNTDYIKRMNIWFKANRKDGKFATDIINFHHYCNSSNQFPNWEINLWKGHGVSPEEDNLDYRLKNMVQYVDLNVNDSIKVWFSEFGYDTEECSTALCQYPELYGNHTAQELQSEWNLRTMLISLSSGIDRMFVYNLCDEPSATQGYVFGSSGLLSSEQTGYEKKESWNTSVWLMNNLNGFTFYKNHPTETVTCMEFRSKTEVKYFYWSPTMDDRQMDFLIGNQRLTATEQVKVFTKKLHKFKRVDAVKEFKPKTKN